MALSTDPFDATELVAVIPEVWSPLVQEAFFDETVLANFITDLSPYLAGGGDILHVPDAFTNVFSVQTQSTQGTEVTTNAPATVDVYLTMDTHKYVAFLIGDADLQLIATDLGIVNKYVKQCVSLLAKALEASIAALWSDLSTYSVTDTATVLSDAEIRQGIEKLDSANVNLAECAFFVHPYVYWNQLHAITKYYQQYSVGPANAAGPVSTGNFGSGNAKVNLRGQLYGIPLYTSTNIVSGLLTYRNFLIHKDCLSFAVRTKGGNKIRVQTDNLVQNLGMLCVVDIFYGVKTLRAASGVLLNASNTFIGS